MGEWGRRDAVVQEGLVNNPHLIPVNSPDLNAAVFVKVQQDVGAIADGR